MGLFLSETATLGAYTGHVNMTKIPVEMTNVQCTSIIHNTCYVNVVEQEILTYNT